MYVYNVLDKSYPIIIEDSWGGVVHIHYSDLEDDEDWKEFIDDLNSHRVEYLRNHKKK